MIPLRGDPQESSITITYELPTSRFGNCMCCYLHAKWLSYLHGLPLLYKPFFYSDEFVLHEKETPWTEEKEKGFDHIVVYDRENGLSHPPEGFSLYTVPPFSEAPDDLLYFKGCLSVNWKDEKFRALVRSFLSPIKKYPPFPFPKGKKNLVTVAIHVRKVGGFDESNSYFVFPLRFAPESYFIECLRRLVDLFPRRPIYAYIFTDDPHPEWLAATFKSHLRELPITFDYRKDGDQYDDHEMEDLFAMTQFDCLIRSASNFSFVATLIADYKVVMTPKSYTWIVINHLATEHYINKIDIEVKP